jgi:DNA-3-methyladenine glycosylase
MQAACRRELNLESTVWQRGEVLAADFFARPTLQVARALLGALLVHERPDGPRVGRVVETEAYIGQDDRGSHARHGRTARTWPMFGPPGHAYVYLIYGIHHCLNVVTEPEGYPAAVLLRALEPVMGLSSSASGPGNLCRAMEIDRRLTNADLTRPPHYFLSGDAPLPAEAINQGPRVGIDYAGDWAQLPWRFWVANSPAVSRPATRRSQVQATNPQSAQVRSSDSS